jgi:PAS domain S-box-containing protein
MGLFFIGCGMVAFGFSSFIAGLLIGLPGGTNLTPTVHNTGAFLGAVLLVTAAALSLQKAPQYKLAVRRRLYLGSCYLVVIILISLFAFAAYRGVVPLYFVQGTGPTILRQCVLGAAAFLFAVSSVIFFRVYRRPHAEFTYWFSIALVLIAIGLSAIFFQKTVGGPIGWTGRMAQYLGCAYLLVGIVAMYRKSGIRNVPLKTEFARSFNYIQANYQMLIDLASDAIISVDKRGSILTWNPAAAGIFGYSEAEAAGASMLNLIFPGEAVASELTKLSGKVAAADGTGNKLETEARRKDGVSFPVEVTVASKHIAGERLSIFIVRDITERKQAEEVLQESNAYLENLFNYANAPIIVWDTKFRITRFNRAFEKLIGRSAAEVIGQSLEILFPPDNVKGSMDLLRETQAGARLETIEIQIQQHHGQVRTLLWNSANVLSADGQTLISTIAQGYDITERKQAEEELHRLAEVVRHSSELVNLATAEGKMIFINDAGARILGIDPDDIDQLDIMQVIPDHLKEKVQSELLPALLEGGTWTGDLQYINAKTRLLTNVHAMAFAIKDTATGAVQYLANVSLDITERKHAEEKLKKAFEELERFTYTISHDLKSPLVTIKTFLGYLRQDIPGANAGNIEKDVSFIEGAADKMSRLLDELLEMSRVGRVVNPPEAVTFGELVQEALNMLAGGIRERGVAVRVGSETLNMYGDRPRLVEIWQNLLENAVKFMGEQASPSIDIGFDQKGTDTVFFVRDNGMGIDPLYKSRVFNLFDKLDAKAEGTGLGLAIVRRIVELYEGIVWFESDGPGQGSCILFTLPAALQDESKGESV